MTYHFRANASTEGTESAGIHELGDNTAHIEHGYAIGSKTGEDWVSERKENHAYNVSATTLSGHAIRSTVGKCVEDVQKEAKDYRWDESQGPSYSLITDISAVPRLRTCNRL